jgi:hypothetical protein
MQWKVQEFITKELGIIDMNTTKHRLIEIAQSKDIEFRETARTFTLKNRDKSNMMYFIFSESLDEIILVDLCYTELEAIKINNEQYTADFIKKELQWSHQMKCSYKNEWVKLNDNLDANCSTGLKCEACTNAGCIKHESNIGDSIITYIDFGEDTDNQMFCLENFHGEHVNYRLVQREDRRYEESALKKVD